MAAAPSLACSEALRGQASVTASSAVAARLTPFSSFRPAAPLPETLAPGHCATASRDTPPRGDPRVAGPGTPPTPHAPPGRRPPGNRRGPASPRHRGRRGAPPRSLRTDRGRRARGPLRAAAGPAYTADRGRRVPAPAPLHTARSLPRARPPRDTP